MTRQSYQYFQGNSADLSDNQWWIDTQQITYGVLDPSVTDSDIVDDTTPITQSDALTSPPQILTLTSPQVVDGLSIAASGPAAANADTPASSIAAIAPNATTAAASNSTPLTLNQVQSFEYIIALDPTAPGLLTLANSSSAQLLILGGFGENSGAAFNRLSVDPTHSKIVLGYVDVGETASYWTPELFSGGSLPSWFGNLNPGWQGLYTVQYWNPAWEQIIFNEIKNVAAEGYDGVFLDVLSADGEWSAGNPEGNPVYANATSALATLVSDIRTYVNNLHLSTPFYIVGNNPQTIAQQDPSVLKNLDGIFNEVAYYVPPPSDGSISVYEGTNAQYISSAIAPIYNAAGVPVFGNDYPPLTNLTADFQSFAFYTALGWIPSVNTPTQTDGVLTTGPYMAMAVPGNTVVTGESNVVNFLSGGLVSAATLVGGNQGDYFIGGPGTNTIQGGAGNDTIYAHPANTALKNILEITLSANDLNATIPSVAILVNGVVVVNPTPITANNQAGATQLFNINTASIGTISSLEIDVTGATYNSQTNYSNVQIHSVTDQGLSINLASATYSNGADAPGAAFSNNGNVIISASAFPTNSPFLADTSDTINGGGGINTVVYRDPYSNYTITNEANGSVLVTSAATAEGPDTLTNIQFLQFSDGAMLNLSSGALSINTGTTSIVNDIGTQVTILAPLANSTIQGAGYDVLDLSQNPIASASSAYSLTSNGNGSFTLATTGSSDIVSGVEQIKFSNETLTIAANNSMNEYAALLYQGALGRTPDAAGLAFWQKFAATLPASIQAYGIYALADPSGIAGGFMNSSEFISKYGSLTNTQFVTQLFANILDRAPDTAGLNFWLSDLNSGLSRQTVLVGFADSTEAISNATHGFTGQSGAHAAWLFLT